MLGKHFKLLSKQRNAAASMLALFNQHAAGEDLKQGNTTHPESVLATPKTRPTAIRNTQHPESVLATPKTRPTAITAASKLSC